MKKLKNYKCSEINCDECPLRMLECKGVIYCNKTLGKVWKDYVLVHTASKKEDKIFISFFEKRLEKEK